MTRPNSIRVALFLGAGASCFAKFPSVDLFFQTALTRGSALDDLCSELARRISINEGNTDNLKWPNFNAEKVFGCAETLEKANEIIGERHPIEVSNGRGLKLSAVELISRLRKEIVKSYGVSVDSGILATAPHHKLLKLLDTAVHEDEPLSIFTTNYDGILEQMFESWDSGTRWISRRTRICNGFLSDRSGQWRPNVFADKPNPGERLINLVKLHGSINWKRDNEGRPVETNYSMPTENDCLLYFGYKSIPEVEPFVTLHYVLRSTLLRSQYIVAIGFRFADPYIRELFDVALEANPELKVLCCLTRVPERSSPISMMMAKFPGRVLLLSNPSGTPIPFGHSEFDETLRQSLGLDIP
jgi:SIR2-like domain